MKVNPTQDRVLVKVLDSVESKTPGGLVLPDTANARKCKKARVVALGPGRYNAELALKAAVEKDNAHRYEPIGFKAGDTVLFRAGYGTEVEHDGETHVLLDLHEVIAVVTE